MDIPNIGDMGDKLKDAKDAVLSGDLMDKVADLAQDQVDKVEALADEKGFGATFDKVVDTIEDKTGLDIDGEEKGEEA
jgi:hypothetical protein